MPSRDPERDHRGFGRRDFLRALSGLPLWLAGSAGLVGLARYLSFEVDPPPTTRFVVGRPEDYPIGSSTPLPEARAVLDRDARGFFALSMICTHLGCTIKATETGYDCPCHGSRFEPGGSVRNGPASSPLQALRVQQDPRGRLVVDTGQTVSREQRLLPA
jgi:cytochrome b6-f complex iron-sulfur subunit